MAEGGVEVVAPHQADRPLAEPNALRACRRPAQRTVRLRGVVAAAGGFLAGLGGLCLFCWLLVGVLAKRRHGKKRCRGENGHHRRTGEACEVTHYRTGHRSTLSVAWPG